MTYGPSVYRRFKEALKVNFGPRLTLIPLCSVFGRTETIRNVGLGPGGHQSVDTRDHRTALAGVSIGLVSGWHSLEYKRNNWFKSSDFGSNSKIKGSNPQVFYLNPFEFGSNPHISNFEVSGFKSSPF